MSSSLYIHIPFCRRKCLFCSFAIAVAQEHRREEYINALAKEMKNHQGKILDTIYLGGGTPSMLDESHIDDLMCAIGRHFSLSDDVEITIEANPESITSAKAKFLKEKKFNRVSLGLQSLNDRYLKFLGRGHDHRMAREAYQILVDAGFTNINLDLMYGFPGQTREELEDDVRKLASMGSQHLSLYTLTIEPQSRFHATQIKLDDDEILAQQYLAIESILGEYGFSQYEISNFAKTGFESKHNRNYWMGLPYIGLGMGAHGFNGQRRYWNSPRLQDYLERMTQKGEALEGFEDLTENQRTMEKILFGLRMNQGIAWDMLPLNKQAQVRAWIEDGFLSLEGERLKTTRQGRLILDELSSRLI